MGDEVETGYALCRKGSSLVKGPTARGGPHEVSIKLACPRGSKLIGVSHHHPGGSLRLSERDRQTAREKKLGIVCVSAKGKRPKCYHFPRR